MLVGRYTGKGRMRETRIKRVRERGKLREKMEKSHTHTHTHTVPTLPSLASRMESLLMSL